MLKWIEMKVSKSGEQLSVFHLEYFYYTHQRCHDEGMASTHLASGNLHKAKD
jgi:leucyl-tRNA synthetase